MTCGVLWLLCAGIAPLYRHNCHTRLDLTDLAAARGKFLQSARGGVGTVLSPDAHCQNVTVAAWQKTSRQAVQSFGPAFALHRFSASGDRNRQDRYGRLSPESSPYKWWTTGHNGCPAATSRVAENRHNTFDFTAQPRALLPPCWADQSGQPAQEDGIEV